jgi:dTDP-4-amino-4,6-dideoxygalactose transaminase
LDLNTQNGPIRDELLAAIVRIVDSQRFILGEEMRELEAAVARYCGAAHGIACASGTDALFLALLACDVGPGDEVLTTPFSFFATAGAISRTGARPVFADIDPATFNIDPERVREALALHPRVKAIIPVHLYGGCADMDPILELARERGCRVIEDAAQAIGAEYKGRRALSIGDVGCLSFYPSKNLGAFGDGGMMTTDDDVIARRLAALRLHGASGKYVHPEIGINSRMDTLQAAVLCVKFKYLDAWTEGRQRNAARYRNDLAGLPVRLPVPALWQNRHVFNQFVIRCAQRDELRLWLQERGVGTGIYYPLPLHVQPCYSDLGYHEGDFPEAEKAAREVLALPVHAGLSSEDLDYVSTQISGFFSQQQRGD